MGFFGGYMSLNVALYQPEIPQNTGNIGRTCVLTESKLHLIKPFGFEINDKQLRRAGLDYWKDLDVSYYESFEHFYEINKGSKIYLSTTKAKYMYNDVAYGENDFIMFGRESCGVPDYIREILRDTSIKIPMIETTDRSLNLSNSAAIIVYEALRQINFPNMK
jgi:tRNA (cytidine/uridine-2'-O-)-methyltransferase